MFERIPGESRKLPIPMSEFTKCIKEKDDIGPDGSLWCTAAYIRQTLPRSMGQTLVYAESSKALRNDSGVCWFKSREEARDALAKSVVLSLWAQDKMVVPHSLVEQRRSSAVAGLSGQKRDYSYQGETAPLFAKRARQDDGAAGIPPDTSISGGRPTETAEGSSHSPANSRQLAIGYHGPQNNIIHPRTSNTASSFNVGLYGGQHSPEARREYDHSVASSVRRSPNDGYHSHGTGVRNFQAGEPHRRGSHGIPGDYTSLDGSRALMAGRGYSVIGDKSSHRRGESTYPVAKLYVNSEGREWIVKQLGLHQCRFFRGENRCNRRKSCPFAHIRNPLGPELRHWPESEQLLLPNQVVLKHDYDARRNEWYTAAYRCPIGNEIYLAEQGGGILCQHGVWWYKSKTQALAALGDVVQTWQSRKK